MNLNEQQQYYSNLLMFKCNKQNIDKVHKCIYTLFKAKQKQQKPNN